MNKYIINIALFLFGFSTICTGSTINTYHREYEDYQPNMFNYYIGLEGTYNVINYKINSLKYKFANNFFAENFLIGVDVDNLFKLEAFYQYAPYFKNNMVISPTEHTMNSFHSFGLAIIPYLKLNKYFDFMFYAGVLRQTAKAYTLSNTFKSTGNAFKFGLGIGSHLNSNIDLSIMYNQIIFTGYSDMKSIMSPSVGFIVKF